VLAVGVCFSEALTYAHDAHVLHGDIKPSNIFVAPTGDKAKLSDFVIAPAICAYERTLFPNDPLLEPVVHVLRRALALRPADRPEDTREFGCQLAIAMETITRA
jgi:serine/threonine protein kinase